MTTGPAHRYVFVAGLHRTGTSLVARILGQHRDIASIEKSSAPENEGCYLQGAIPHTARHGIPGHYALDPSQHFTEEHALNSLETKTRLELEWGDWFDPAKPWRVEKSPVNLTRMRLLQGLFPQSHFIIVTRHPLFMAHALQKWTDQDVPDIARYGVEAYRLALADLQYLHHAIVLRYEDLVANPAAHLRAIESFLGLASPLDQPDLRDGNSDYMAKPSKAGSIDELGYHDNGLIGEFEPIVQHPLRANRETAQSLMSARPR